MSDLTSKKCEPCNIGAPLATEEEIEHFLEQLIEWEIVEVNNVSRLTRTFTFKNFVEALQFASAVGAIAEEQQHHPTITISWGNVIVRWWTHKIKGLHANDFIMAAKTDMLYG